MMQKLRIQLNFFSEFWLLIYQQSLIGSITSICNESIACVLSDEDLGTVPRCCSLNSPLKI